MKLARYAEGRRTCLGRVEGDTVTQLLADDGSNTELLVRHLAGESRSGGAQHALDDVRLLAPIARPGKILCIGLNYADHCRESGMEPPAAPVLFAKYANAVIGPHEAISFDPRFSTQVDYEAELVAVIGRGCSRVGEAEALDCVAGYTIANDVSARDAQFSDGQWVRSKSFDTFCPLGPWITTADEIGDPQALAIRCWVGDELRQDGNTADMIFGVAALVSYLSQVITLEPGDVVLTGTPWGVGFARTPPVYLQDGDVVRVAVEGIGELVNPVHVAAAAATPPPPGTAGARQVVT
jgi:2-keto-4-pentenoate hydratase/2-oxohepta-3-ene-1,7-dioic acid hydratase in catechol pathway